MPRAAVTVLLCVAAAAAPLALADVTGPAIAVGNISFDGPAEPDLGKALVDLLSGDLLHQVEQGGPFEDCDAAMVDIHHRAAAEAEIKLQQSEYFDPATRLEPGHFIEPTHRVDGHLILENGTFRWFVEVLDVEGGGKRVAYAEGTAPKEDYFRISEQMARQVAEALCDGSWTALGGNGEITVTGWARRIDEPFQLLGDFQGGSALFTYSPDDANGGSVSYGFSGSGVTGGGSGRFTMKPLSDGTMILETSTHGCVDGIANSCRDNTHRVILTPVKRRPSAAAGP